MRHNLPSPPGEGPGVRPVMRHNLPSPPGEGPGVRPLFCLLLALLSLMARAGNVVTLPTVTGAPGDEVTLTVSLQNTDAVSAVQVQCRVDDGLAVVAGSEVLSDRAAAHSARVGIRDGVLNIMVWSNALAPLQGSSGEVLSFRVVLGNEPSTIALVASRVTLTDPDGNPVAATATDGSVTIGAPKVQLASRDIDYGHIPIRDTYHQSLQVTNVGNVPLTVTGIDPSAPEFSSETAFPLVIAAGATDYVDLTYRPVERGAIEETVRLLSDNIAGTNTIRLTADPFAVNELHVGDASGIADSTVTIHLRVNNMDAISGFQLEFDLPEQLRYVDGSFALSSRKADHQLTVTHHGQHLTAIAWSLTDGATFSGEDGDIATFDVTLSGRYGTELRASKAMLTATYRGKDMDVLSDHYGGWIDIQSPQLNATDQLDLGATPVTETAQGTVNVYNGGGAPLRIDRVVFDTLGFTVAEAMPLVIEPWQSVDLHVTYDGQEQAPYAAWMQLYSNDPDHRLHNIRVTGSRYAPNFLSFTADEVVNGADLLVHVDLGNYDPIEGLQFDLHYPQWFTPTGEYTVVDRAQGFSVAQRTVGQGVTRCFVYSLADGTMAPGEGRILTLPFTTDPDTPEGEYTLTIDNIKAGTGALTDKYAGAEEQCTVTVSHRLWGDVNLDGTVDVADVNIVVNIILGLDQASNYDGRADVDSNGYVDVGDVNELVNIILGKD